MEIDQDEYARAILNANLWMMRARVATALAFYFCEIADYTGALIDIKWEVEHQADRLLDLLSENENGPRKVREHLDELRKPKRTTDTEEVNQRIRNDQSDSELL